MQQDGCREWEHTAPNHSFHKAPWQLCIAEMFPLLLNDYMDLSEAQQNKHIPWDTLPFPNRPWVPKCFRGMGSTGRKFG